MISSDPRSDREIWASACDAVLQSRTFARSDQLAQFLRYICDLELSGRGSEITEYTIAVNALNRPANYNPVEDSSVRSRAHALRRKLKEYYETEAPDAEVRIELPKGAYRPLFTRGSSNPVPATPEPEIAAAPDIRLHLPVVVGVVLAAILGTALLTRAFFPRTADPVESIVREAWGPALHPGNNVLILTGAPPVVRAIPSQLGQKPQGNILQPAPGWLTDWYRSLNVEDRGGPLFTFPTRGYLVFCDSLAAMSATALLSNAGVTWHAAPEPTVRPMTINENALLLIGAPSYTGYMARLLKAMPYSIWFDPATNEEVLGDRTDPARPVFRARRDPSTSRYVTVYGLVTVLPAQPGHPRPERTLIFSGFMGSPGAQAALEYFRSPSALRDLEERFRKEGHDSFPDAFQVVVRCGVDQDVAINAVYAAHRIIQPVPVIE